jgi:putative ABC transport system permease protein
MNFVALKMLVGDRLKYLALIAGVSFAALLITQQASIFAGYTLRTGTWIRETTAGGADLWVMDPQVEFSEGPKPLSDTALQRVRGVSGVAWAAPLYKGWLECRLPDGTKKRVRLIGIDDATLAAGPAQMVEGKLEDLRRDRAIIINVEDAASILALDRSGGRPLRVGDRLDINDNESVVVGTYRAGKEFFWEPVVYTTYTRALAYAPPERRLLCYVLVRVASGGDRAEVARRIEQSTGLKAYTGTEFEWLTADYILKKTGILVNFGMTIGLGFVIGLLVAGQTFYTFVLDNLRHFAALKAMGAANATVLRMLCLQVVTVGSIGYGIGVGGASVTGMLFGSVGLAFQMHWLIPAVGSAAVLACCLAAGMLGMIRVLRLEPSVVFKG